MSRNHYCDKNVSLLHHRKPSGVYEWKDSPPDPQPPRSYDPLNMSQNMTTSFSGGPNQLGGIKRTSTEMVYMYNYVLMYTKTVV